MKRLLFGAAALAAFAVAVSAQAITLTNRDQTDQKFVVIEGDKQAERTLKAGEKVEICLQSCVIRMPDNEMYEFEGKEIVSLEEGLLFLDDPDPAPKTVP